MKCTHLVSGRGISSCLALERPYVPSVFELGEYCKKGEHRKCPLLLRATKGGKRHVI